MIQNGFLNVLVQLDKMVDYWHHMLKEFPDHPAASMVSASAPLSLYGALVSVFLCFFEIWRPIYLYINNYIYIYLYIYNNIYIYI